MKQFKYKWKIGGNETIGSKECADENALKAHIENVGGELMEILEQSEVIKKDEEKEKPPITQNGAGPERILQAPERKRKKGSGEPSTGIKVLAGLYCLPTLVGQITHKSLGVEEPARLPLGGFCCYAFLKALN